MTRPVPADRGSAIIEFHFLGILLLVPLVYILLAVLDVQRTSYGVTQAAREAGRIYVATGDEGAARRAAQVALEDQGVEPGTTDPFRRLVTFPVTVRPRGVTWTPDG